MILQILLKQGRELFDIVDRELNSVWSCRKTYILKKIVARFPKIVLDFSRDLMSLKSKNQLFRSRRKYRFSRETYESILNTENP